MAERRVISAKTIFDAIEQVEYRVREHARDGDVKKEYLNKLLDLKKQVEMMCEPTDRDPDFYFPGDELE